MGEIEAMPQVITGYLASPLTSVVSDPISERSLNELVGKVRSIVCSDRFLEPTFDLYWPGDYTHPTRHRGFKAAQVYLTDRSQASSFDFVIFVCASPSFGVGQENEIVTQAGLPAIRLVPHGVSRMMSGSFLQSIDIEYSGALHTGIEFSEDELVTALHEVRTIIFDHRGQYQKLVTDDFRMRLGTLIQDRFGNNLIFARRLGVNNRYVDALLSEPLTVSNPSAQLLKRMSAILHVSVGFLLGETEDTNPIWVESNATWHEWAKNSKGLDGSIMVSIRDEWREQFRENRKLDTSPLSPRRKTAVNGNHNRSMSVDDWSDLYAKRAPKAGDNNGQHNLFKTPIDSH